MAVHTAISSVVDVPRAAVAGVLHGVDDEDVACGGDAPELVRAKPVGKTMVERGTHREVGWVSEIHQPVEARRAEERGDAHDLVAALEGCDDDDEALAAAEGDQQDGVGTGDDDDTTLDDGTWVYLEAAAVDGASRVSSSSTRTVGQWMPLVTPAEDRRLLGLGQHSVCSPVVPEGLLMVLVFPQPFRFPPWRLPQLPTAFLDRPNLRVDDASQAPACCCHCLRSHHSTHARGRSQLTYRWS